MSMNNKQLLLKTIFCCMACDGDIAAEEIAVVGRLSAEHQLLSEGLEEQLNTWVKELNERGSLFLRSYINELSASNLEHDEEMKLVALAIETIEADERIEYSEVKFFKRIRRALKMVSNEEILAQHPDKEDFLLEDNFYTEEIEWEGTQFDMIKIADYEA